MAAYADQFARTGSEGESFRNTGSVNAMRPPGASSGRQIASARSTPMM
jgi:hypothetical protein